MNKFLQTVLISVGISTTIQAFAGTSSLTYSQSYRQIFTTPSGNIACGGDSKTGSNTVLHCYIQDLAKKPAQCKKQGVGLEFTLSKTGSGKLLCSSHEFEPDNFDEEITKVLPYGSSISGNGWKCDSTTTGLNCSNNQGHGFRLSRQTQSTY